MTLQFWVQIVKPSIIVVNWKKFNFQHCTQSKVKSQLHNLQHVYKLRHITLSVITSLHFCSIRDIIHYHHYFAVSTVLQASHSTCTYSASPQAVFWSHVISCTSPNSRVHAHTIILQLTTAINQFRESPQHSVSVTSNNEHCCSHPSHTVSQVIG